jgi:hypothetical protein
VGPNLGEPAVDRRAASGGVDDEVGADLPLVGADAGHARRVAGDGEEPHRFHPAPHRHAGLGAKRALQDPVDGGPPGHERCQPLVARPGRGIGQRRGHVRRERGLDHAGGEQVLVDVGQPIPQQLAAAGHDDVGLDDLRRRRAERRRGGGLDVGRRVQAVPFQDEHPVPGPGQQQRGERARPAGADDGDLHRTLLSWLRRVFPDPTTAKAIRHSRQG